MSRLRLRCVAVACAVACASVLASVMFVAPAPARASSTYCSSVAAVGSHTLTQYQQNWTGFSGSATVTGSLYNFTSAVDMPSLAEQTVGSTMWVGHENFAPVSETSSGWHILTYIC